MQAQTRFSGTVADADGEPLAFVSILVDDGAAQGFLSDIDGRFEVFSKKEIGSLTFRCIGFEPKSLAADFLKKQSGPLEIRLRPVSADIAEVTIRPGENPAHRIVRLAVEHRAENDPERLDGFRCTTYLKVAVDLLPDSTALEKPKNKFAIKERLIKIAQTPLARPASHADSLHFFLMESATDLRFRFPDRRQETVLLSRASGFKTSLITAAGTQLQPFSFARDFLPIMGLQFLNPISPGSPSRYHFLMMDTTLVGRDTVWGISFWPRKGHAFEGLKGRFSINSNQYALQNMVVEPADRKLTDISLEQEFSFLTDTATGLGHWFPTMMNYAIVNEKYPSPFVGMQIVGRNRMADVRLNPPFGPRDFDPVQPLTMEKSSVSRDSARWLPLRLEPLTRRDLATYRHLDSLGDRWRMDRFANLLAITANGILPIKEGWPVRIDINRLVKFNQFERARLGIGLTTSNPFLIEKRKTRWLWTGWAGYGLRDRTWKAATYLQYRIRRQSETFAALGAEQELLPPGALSQTTAGLVGGNYYANQVDDLRAVRAELGSRLGPSVTAAAVLASSLDRPRYTYYYMKSDAAADSIGRFRFAEAGLTVKFSRMKRGQLLLGKPVAPTNRWPDVQVRWVRGFSDILGGRFGYDRFELLLEQHVPVRGLGRLDWVVTAGAVVGSSPISRLFTINRGSGSGFALFSFGQTFQNVDTLFLSDRFVSVYFQQTIGTPFWKMGWSKPLISIVQNAAIGDLKNPERHLGVGFLTPRRGLFETGVKFDDLVRINYLHAVRLGLGFGVYSRWGELASPRIGENISLRLGFHVGI